MAIAVVRAAPTGDRTPAYGEQRGNAYARQEKQRHRGKRSTGKAVA